MQPLFLRNHQSLFNNARLNYISFNHLISEIFDSNNSTYNLNALVSYIPWIFTNNYLNQEKLNLFLFRDDTLDLLGGSIATHAPNLLNNNPKLRLNQIQIDFIFIKRSRVASLIPLIENFPYLIDNRELSLSQSQFDVLIDINQDQGAVTRIARDAAFMFRNVRLSGERFTSLQRTETGRNFLMAVANNAQNMLVGLNLSPQELQELKDNGRLSAPALINSNQQSQSGDLRLLAAPISPEVTRFSAIDPSSQGTASSLDGKAPTLAKVDSRAQLNQFISALASVPPVDAGMPTTRVEVSGTTNQVNHSLISSSHV
ncbi:hypothetical protein [Ralstonia chuxiongensis]|uniref:hypothetical protein n=1 Tax=Ralstonia chuxiongensis TaxID=2957504 RepID=UPI00292EE870|nr:hypothetical protein [Ralstonia chuxiongensis]